MLFILYYRAAVVQIPKTPPKYKKEAILERRRLFERNEGEVRIILFLTSFIIFPNYFYLESPKRYISI